MMDFGPIGIFVLIVTSAASFLLARWLSKRGATSAASGSGAPRRPAQSRQVRRARERRK